MGSLRLVGCWWLRRRGKLGLSVSVVSVSVLSVGEPLNVDAEKDGDSGKPFSNWLASSCDAIGYMGILKNQSSV